MGSPRREVAWLLFAMVLLAAVMRLPITAVGPLLGLIREATQISNLAAGLLTSLPLLAFASLSLLTPALSRSWGQERLICSALALLLLGNLLRPLGGVVLLFGGTLLIGVAIAVCNVILPSLVKQDFPQQLGLATGLYLISMSVAAAVASAASVPLASLSGWSWRGSLQIWSIFIALTLGCWLLRLRHRGGALLSHHPRKEQINVWLNPLAWQITIVMGLQSAFFYVGVAWWPAIVVSHGLSSTEAGLMLSLMQCSGLPATFVVPLLAAKMKNQRLLLLLTVAATFLGILGVMWGSSRGIIALATVCYGLGSGIGFALSVMLFSLRSSSAAETASLSGMAQSVGYLLAATQPPLFGLIYALSGSWTAPLLLLLLLNVLLFGVGMPACAPTLLRQYSRR